MTGEFLHEYSTKTSQLLLLNFPESEEVFQTIGYLEDEVLTSEETLVVINEGMSNSGKNLFGIF